MNYTKTSLQLIYTRYVFQIYFGQVLKLLKGIEKLVSTVNRASPSHVITLITACVYVILYHLLSCIFRHPLHLTDTSVLDSDSLWLPSQDTFLLEKADTVGREEKVRCGAIFRIPREFYMCIIYIMFTLNFALQTLKGGLQSVM